MKERVRFAVGAASMVLAACCLMGALFTAWLRCAAGAVTQAAGWADAAAGFEGTTVGGWYRPAGGWYAAPGNAGGGAGQLTGQ